MRGAAVHTGGKSPLLPSCRNGLLGLFTFRVLLLCNRRMDRKTLMKSINYSRSMLLTVSLLFSQPCTFTTHLLTLQVQWGNISPACLCFCSCYGEDLENLINFVALQCSTFAASQVCASTVLVQLSCIPQEVEMQLLGFAFVQSLICSVFISQQPEKSNKNTEEELQHTCNAGEFCWCCLDFIKCCIFIWVVGLMKIT